MSKILIWKQFTTTIVSSLRGWNCSHYVKDTHLKAIHNNQLTKSLTAILFPLCQRYSFESNSQHNIACATQFSIVPTMSKILIWKQFTTNSTLINNGTLLFPLCQRYSFESNSQHTLIMTFHICYCSHYVKDTHLKAIHNCGQKRNPTKKIVPTMSKILIWKQFTTLVRRMVLRLVLFPLCQRYSFESNSQLYACWFAVSIIVPTMSKILIWKQFTTLRWFYA